MSFEGASVRARPIAVDYAAHSAQVEETREALLDGCATVAPRTAEVPFYSAVTGGLLDTNKLGRRLLVSKLARDCAVRAGTQAALGDGVVRALVEVSPHPVLTASVQEIVEEVVERGGGIGKPRQSAVLGTLRRDAGDTRRFCGRSPKRGWPG